MTVAPILPDRQEWTVDDLADLPEGFRYTFGVHTTDVFSVSEPWPITIDLPALSRRRAEFLARAESRQ